MNERRTWFVGLFAAGFFSSLQLLLGPLPVHAQSQPPAPTIFVAAVVRVTPTVATRIPIMIGPPKAIPQGAFLLIRELPTAAILSEGQSLDATTWIVPIADTPRLKITAPADSTGSADISLILATGAGSVLARTKVKLIIGPLPSRETKQQKPASLNSPASAG